MLNYLKKFFLVILFFIVDLILVAAVIESLYVGFSQYYDSEEYYTFNFSNYMKTIMSVFIFFTSNNSPEMYIYEFPENSILTLTIVFLIWINNILLLGIIIGLS